MRVKSFIQNDIGLTPVELELTLTPGLPQIKFLGMPDPLIKESEVRIRTALRRQGFDLPRAQQILIQLRPQEVRKHSRGLDLAVAAAYLWETGQVPKPRGSVYVYGDLDFEGNVKAPDDAADISTLGIKQQILTGVGSESLSGNHVEVNSLKELLKPQGVPLIQKGLLLKRPSMEGVLLPQKSARLSAIIAAGEHSALFAGPPGTGKTTLAENIFKILADPDKNEWMIARQIARRCGTEIWWRPLRRPHHSASWISIVGGGAKPVPGEITKAHGGMLLFDELLEFDPRALEALREPLETGRILVSRAGGSSVYPARFLFVATTNFCQCGAYFPDTTHRCHCTLQKRRSYVQKLSGPLLDRFAILALSHEWGCERGVPLVEIYQKVQRAQAFARAERHQERKNSQLQEVELTEQIEPKALKFLEVGLGSQRRHKFKLQVARTIADLEEAEMISTAHLDEAEELTTLSMKRLQLDILRYI